MTIKKKIKRIRAAKINTNISIEDSEESELLQMHVKDEEEIAEN